MERSKSGFAKPGQTKEQINEVSEDLNDLCKSI